MHGELFDWLAGRGFTVDPGALGENITTSGLDVLTLPRGTLLHIGGRAVVEVTGLRNPCSQIEDFQPGLLKELVGRNDDGGIVRRAGIMGVVLQGGPVRAGDCIAVELPEGPWQVLDRV